MGPLYDCHTHIGVELAHYLSGAFPYAQHLETLCADLDRAGIDRVVVFPMATHLQMGLRALAGKGAPTGKSCSGGCSCGSDGSSQLRCSFCNKSRDQVGKLIAGTNVWICNECIDLCNEIIGDDLSPYPYQFENQQMLSEVFDLFDDLAPRVRPFVIIDPSRQTEEQIRGLEGLAERYAIAGLKVQATMVKARVTDLPRTGFLDLAERHDWPVLIHSAVHPDDTWSQVADILDVVQATPRVRFNVAHTLRFDKPALDRLAELPNAWFDVSAFCIHCDLATEDSPVVAVPDRRFATDYGDCGQALCDLAAAYPDRLLWGSDAPYYSYVAPYTDAEGNTTVFNLRSSMVRETAALRSLPEDLLQRVAGDNPRAWLGGAA